jgi:hypothetical protein
MGRAGAVHQTELDRLKDEYLDMRAEIKKVRARVEAEFREKIEAEFEYQTHRVKRAFAVRFVELKEAGATRKELVRVIGDGTAEVMRELIELGGGTVRKTLTGEERRAERGENLGVREIAPGRFVYTSKGGQEVETYLLWQNGKPALWADGDDVLILRDDFKDAAGLRKIGAEIASAFNITEEA